MVLFRLTETKLVMIETAELETAVLTACLSVDFNAAPDGDQYAIFPGGPIEIFLLSNLHASLFPGMENASPLRSVMMEISSPEMVVTVVKLARSAMARVL